MIMENTVRSDDREGSDAASQPENRAHAPAEIPRPGGSGRDDVVSVCAWCPELHVLRLEKKLDDVIMFGIAGTGRIESAWRKRPGKPATRLTISDGICDACRAKLLAEGRP